MIKIVVVGYSVQYASSGNDSCLYGGSMRLLTETLLKEVIERIFAK